MFDAGYWEVPLTGIVVNDRARVATYRAMMARLRQGEDVVFKLCQLHLAQGAREGGLAAYATNRPLRSSRIDLWLDGITLEPGYYFSLGGDRLHLITEVFRPGEGPFGGPWVPDDTSPWLAGQSPWTVDRPEGSWSVKISPPLRSAVTAGAAVDFKDLSLRCQPRDLSDGDLQLDLGRFGKLELVHVQAFIPKAIAAGRMSLALGTALQFESGMRQKDVIGEWLPVPTGEEPTGIVLRGRRGTGWRGWANGLTWADLGRDLVISKETTKTGALVSHDLKEFPLVMSLLAQIPVEQRIGGLIIDETAGRPYAEFAYARDWRVIAREAGIPDAVWNTDARAGAITEAEDAGADLDTIRGSVGHAQATTTARYSRGAIGKSRKVAQARVALRGEQNNG